MVGLATHTLILKTLLEAIENLALSGKKAALEHGGFCDWIVVALCHSLADRSRRVPDLETDVPKSNQRLANDLLHLFVHRVFVLQKKNVHIAHGCELTTAIAAECNDS